VSDAALERLRDWHAQLAVVAGSGLASLVADAGAEAISFDQVDGLPRSSVPGHAGKFVRGNVDGTPIVFALGRVHLYEGHSARDVTAAVRFLASSGITQLVLTNAAGSANPAFAIGSWMMINDHLNLTGTTPLLGGANFIDMSEPYSATLRHRFRRAANASGINLHEGVYAGLLGPQYETPAEVRMLQRLGADAIGMSTVLETIQARALGMEVAGFSCLTNAAAGLSPQHLSHAEVLETGKAAAADFARLLSAFVQQPDGHSVSA
jgi:purine-nucleoside phosphorylase